MSEPLDFTGYVAPDAPGLFRRLVPDIRQVAVEFSVRTYAPIVVATGRAHGCKWGLEEPLVGNEPTAEQMARMSARVLAAMERHGWIVERARSSRYWAQRLRFLTRKRSPKQGRSI